MAFATLEPVGLSFQDVTTRVLRDLKTANKQVGKQVAAVGRKAMLADVKSRRGTLSFGRGKLNVKARDRSTSAGCEVEFRGAPAGSWAIVSTGSKAHPIRVRRAKALHWGGDGYAKSVQHPGTSGRQYWQSAGVALDKAVEDVIEDVYDEALVA